MRYQRIDGGSSLEAREAAIQAFNAPNSPVFIFLLSIRAAGRGLNLQARSLAPPLARALSAFISAPFPFDIDVAASTRRVLSLRCVASR